MGLTRGSRGASYASYAPCIILYGYALPICYCMRLSLIYCGVSACVRCVGEQADQRSRVGRIIDVTASDVADGRHQR